MRLDPVIQRRFEELKSKAESALAQRVVEFTDSDTGVPYYKVPGSLFYEWTTNVQNLFARVFGQDSIHFTSFADRVSAHRGWESSFQNCVAVFDAAREDYEGGYLFNVRALVKAEVLSDAFDQARHLLDAGFKDPACVLARVALEVALKEVAQEHGIAEGKLDKMNSDLCKAGVYNMVKQKQITAWADIGNKAAHGKWSEYSDSDAGAMLSGVEGIVGELL